MENKLLTEITDFKNDVKENGMVINTYLSKRKELIQKIESANTKSIEFFRVLYFYDLISKEQYLDYKMRIDNARKLYKQELSFY
jgi:chlorite dismutase